MTTHDGKLIGTVSLFAVSLLHQHAELGIAIYPRENHNQGYGTDAIITMCGFGFLYKNLNSIWLKFFEFNENGRLAYEKTGFTNLSNERQAIYREGKHQDILRMDILKLEWMEKFPEYKLRPPMT